MSNIEGHGPELVSLVQWTENNFPPLLKAKSAAELDEAFQNFFFAEPTIIVNGSPSTLSRYKSLIEASTDNEVSATVNIQNIVEALDKSDSKVAGVVGLFFTAVIRQKEPGNLPSPYQRTITSSLNLVIERDDSIKGPVFEERRRVKAFNQVLVDTVGPVIL
ncbi:hypothetical protein NEOLEDRAFT_1138781 [Neolentinus lepideus HHB14362 ss-1]|uniref:SnoaL-like domain-containing protein n=1 Tax=Neolentinus lepideus HHB14362 ss-1 TaxID=1314782 RepID=A0A165Q1U9_9AGAM|nr:hypothetical protein NEOLEDRAFT_1138781 [Neolentinus lepideus HHB14362 ss-1]